MMALLMGVKTVTPSEVMGLLQAHRITVVDVNSAERWQAAHVPGAMNLDPQRYASADLPQEMDAELVFYCSNPLCRKAPQAARRAKAMGYRNVRVMAAGIKGWLEAGMPTEGRAV